MTGFVGAGKPHPYDRISLFHYDGACTGGSRTAPTNDATFIHI